MNIVKVVTPPALIEQSRSLQYANRESLNARFFSKKIQGEIKRRKLLRAKQSASSEEKEGGKLEFNRQKTIGTWKRRRSFVIPSYFLRPEGNYDSQGRLTVATSTEGEKFTTPNEDTPFLIQGNKLYSEPRLINNSDYRVEAEASYKATDERALQPDSFDSTLEAFIELPNIEQAPIIEAIDINSYNPFYTPPPYNIEYVTENFSGYIFLETPYFSAQITKVNEVLFANNYAPAYGMTGPWYAEIFHVNSSGNSVITKINLGIASGEFYFAITWNNNKLNIYINGQRLIQLDHYPYIISEFTFNISFTARALMKRHFYGPTGTIPPVTEQNQPFFDVPFKISRIRFTFDSIYSGSSFTPPPTITGPY